jgi:hypothetical protein
LKAEKAGGLMPVRIRQALPEERIFPLFAFALKISTIPSESLSSFCTN